MNTFKKNIIFFIISLFFGNVLYAQYYPNFPEHTPKSVMKIAKDAAKYVSDTGDTEEINKLDGKFTKGIVLDYRYAVATDCNDGMLIAHPFHPSLLNKKGLVRKIKGAKGNLYLVEACSLIKEKAQGVFNAFYRNVPKAAGFSKSEQRIDRVLIFSLPVEYEGIKYMISSVARGMDQFTLAQLNLMVK